MASASALGALVVLRALDVGFDLVPGPAVRPVIGDWGYLGPGVGVLGDSIGGATAAPLVAVAVVLRAGAGRAAAAGPRSG